MHQFQNRILWSKRLEIQFLIGLITLFFAFEVNTHAWGQIPDQAPDSLAADASSATIEISESNRRFEQILRSRPQEGTALDKFYEVIYQQGQVQAYCDQLNQEASEKKDGGLYQLLGLLLLKQGKDADARQALENARRTRQNDPATHIYLAQAYISTGQDQDAFSALQEGLALKPPSSLVPNVIQLLIRLGRSVESHERLAKIGGMIESHFSTNSSLLKKLADSYLQCKSPDLAKPLLEKLASAAKSPQEKIELQMQLADTKSLLGENNESLADFEQLLDRVHPDSWLSESITKSIERLVQMQGDEASLISYYRGKLDAAHEDLPNGLSRPSADKQKRRLRLATLLTQSNRSDEALEVIREALVAAPSDPKPLLAMEDLYNARHDTVQAAATMKRLVELDPNNIDYRVRWGRYVSMISESAILHQSEAAGIWGELMAGHEDDPAMAVRVAELMHSIARTKDAIDYYKLAVRLSGNDVQYREYLGEYLYRLGQPAEALAALQSLAEKERDGAGYVRLSEVLAQMQFESQALQAMIRACDLNPTCDHLIRCAAMLRDSGQLTEALERLDAAEKLATRSSEISRIWSQKFYLLPQVGSLRERIEELTKQLPLTRNSDEKSRYYQNLAMLREVNGEHSAAVEAASTATQIAPNSIFAWLLASKIYREVNLPTQELQALDTLCRLDAANRLDYLQRMATLNMQLRRPTEALLVGDRLLSEPGATPQHFKFFIALCGEAQQRQQAVAVLKRQIDRNPRDAYAHLMLARIQFELGQVGPSIETTWKALERTTKQELAHEIIPLLINAYRKIDQIRDLPELLRKFGLEHERQHDAAYWIAFAQQELGDPAAAWQSLQRRVSQSETDIELLQLALNVAMASHHHREAVECQRQLNRLQPSHAGQLRLGELHFDLGDAKAAEFEWRNALSQRNNDAETIRCVREWIIKRRYDISAAILNVAAEVAPDNWELAALGIAAHHQSGNPVEAVRFAERILSLTNAFDQASLAAEESTRSDFDDVNLDWVASRAPSSKTETNRLAWLERADQWQSMFNTLDRYRAAIRLQESVASLSQRNAIHQLARQRGAAVQISPHPSYYLPTFGDAHALAVLAKYGKINASRATEGETQSAFVTRSSNSKDNAQLWDAILVLQPTATGPNDDNSDSWGLYSKCLDELAELGDDWAIQLALNNIVVRRAMQVQMLQRRMESKPRMDLSTINRFEHLLDLCYRRGQRPDLVVDMQLSRELELIGRDQDARKVAARGLDGSRNLEEVAQCARKFLPNDVVTTKKILLQGCQVHRDALVSDPGVNISNALNELFDIAWQRDSQQFGKESREFLAFFSQLMMMHGDTIERSESALFEWDPSASVQDIWQMDTTVRFSPAMSFVRASPILPRTLLLTLRHISSLTKNQHETAGLVDLMVAQEPAAPRSSNRGRALVQLICKATWSLSNQNPQAAIAFVREAKTLGIAVDLLSLWESQLLIHTNDPSTAIKLLAQVQAVNERMEVDKYLLVLQASKMLGKTQLIEDTFKQLSNSPMTMLQSDWYRQLNNALVQ
jgi:tetratricopeptide (TPR) repeat protein